MYTQEHPREHPEPCVGSCGVCTGIAARRGAGPVTSQFTERAKWRRLAGARGDLDLLPARDNWSGDICSIR